MERIINNIINRPDQAEQHRKEADYLELLKSWCKNNNHRFKTATVSEDIKLGIDCYIDFKPYDLKGSVSRKFTVNKYAKKDGKLKWYNPCSMHTEVQYIVPYDETGEQWLVISKDKVMEWAFNHPELHGRYDGDGNKNIYIIVDDLSQYTILEREEKNNK